MMVAVSELWVEEPLRSFVEESQVLFALLLHPSGQVLGQHGFTRSVEVMSACALAAAIHASSAALGRELESAPFSELHHGGQDRQIFLARVETAQGELVLFSVFDRTTSLGLVRIYFDEFRRLLALAAPTGPAEPALAASFEQELNRSLASLFGRARPRELPPN
jgi:predicted regulator of Ras-like GTPase activity (Roadblock/LC7/MglB family)